MQVFIDIVPRAAWIGFMNKPVSLSLSLYIFLDFISYHITLEYAFRITDRQTLLVDHLLIRLSV